MKKIQFLTFILAVLVVSGCSSKNEVEPGKETESEINIQDASLNDTNTTDADIATEKIQSTENIVDSAESNSTARVFSKFEKTFIYHIAYNHYRKAINLMYAKDHKGAYEEAMKAKEIYKNNDQNLIHLPYIPGYVRESAQTPRRIFYKIIEKQNYELNRLIRKIKLLNPPIPLIRFNQTSTYIDVIVTNVGDTPFDNLSVEINYEPVTTFEKINPNDTKRYRYNSVAKLENISFKEEFGFAPKTIEFEQE